jgi:hypothetical protein
VYRFRVFVPGADPTGDFVTSNYEQARDEALARSARHGRAVLVEVGRADRVFLRGEDVTPR